MAFKQTLKIKDLKFAAIDYEFFNTNDYTPEMVCCSITLSDTKEVAEFWLLDDQDKKDELNSYIAYLNSEGYYFLAYAAIAEARAMLAHGTDPLKLKWVDEYCEWLCLKNHNHELGYGKQLIKGMKKFTRPPKNKYQQTEEEKKKSNGSKAENNLAAFLYKMLGVVVDTAHKTKMRDIIISKDRTLILENKEAIQKYCTSDVKYLYPALLKADSYYKSYYDPSDYRKLVGDMMVRSEYSVRTALIEQEGYGIDYESTRNFSDNVKFLIEECQREILALFPETPIFKWKKSEHRYGMDTKVVRGYIKTLDPDVVDRWERTDSGMLSLKLDAFKNVFDFRHDYPTDILGAQIVRYLVLQQNMNGFKPTNGKKKRTFWDSVGSDQRVRPFLGIYGSQSGRNQPSATGFLFLKSAWMRALCKPPEGYMYVGIDYGSEEFLIGGLVSGDRNMIDAYHSGDPYLYFGKAAKAIPEDGTKQSHSFLRDKFKSTCLAKGTLVHTDKGLKEIQTITPNELVWDGETFRRCEGVKSMGVKPVTDFEGIRLTADHRILTNRGWEEVHEIEKEDRGVQRCKRLPRPSQSWSDVWKLACRVGRAYIKKKII